MVISEVLAAMQPGLQTLTMHGNPLSNASDPKHKDPPLMPHYR